MDDRKYFDQYRAFRLNPLVRLSILAPGLGRDRKRSDLALQTSDRRSQRQNFEQEVAEVTEIKNWDAKKRRTAAGTFGWGRAPALPVEAKPSKTSRSKTLVESMAFFEEKTRNAPLSDRRKLLFRNLQAQPPVECFASVISVISCSRIRLCDLLSDVRTGSGPFPPLTANLTASVCGREWPDRCPRSWQQHLGSSPVVGWCECALLPVPPD